MNAVHDSFPPADATHAEVRMWRQTSCDPFARQVAKLLDARPWMTVAEVAKALERPNKDCLKSLNLLAAIACVVSRPKLGNGKRSVYATPAGAESGAGKARMWSLLEHAGLVQHQVDWRPNETTAEDHSAL